MHLIAEKPTSECSTVWCSAVFFANQFGIISGLYSHFRMYFQQNKISTCMCWGAHTNIHRHILRKFSLNMASQQIMEELFGDWAEKWNANAVKSHLWILHIVFPLVQCALKQCEFRESITTIILLRQRPTIYQLAIKFISLDRWQQWDTHNTHNFCVSYLGLNFVRLRLVSIDSVLNLNNRDKVQDGYLADHLFVVFYRCLK